MPSTIQQVRTNITKTGHVSAALESARLERVVFDPRNVRHRAAYLAYMQTGKWPIYFHAELPHITVPATVEHKLLKHYLEGQKAVVEQARMFTQEG